MNDCESSVYIIHLGYLSLICACLEIHRYAAAAYILHYCERGGLFRQLAITAIAMCV